ncbi:class I SAM-dependent methyltransferase [Alkalithermobacter paradoxus]|uniref:Ubiquinone/menaquinone biosynthesis C-methyltransferase UbiE n=1 Tax=Alkalithermobacter paradoxus TaxID=29349 RepID=A0A1V4I918_9FIRM|nr:ubiquinone/menaquinone biosynthesis C-methyltransferase UbiE [[Clostridium] thermoalcaliphilum]
MGSICTEGKIEINGSICPDKKRNNVQNFVERINPTVGEKILLVGNVSNYGKYLNKLGVEVTILENENDIYKSAALQNCNCNVIKGNLEYIPFKKGYFDKIIFLNYFNSFQDEEKVLKELCRVLKYNGNIIIQENNPKSLYSKLIAISKKVSGCKCKFYNLDEIMNMFQASGFDGICKNIDKYSFIYVGRKIKETMD